MIAKNRSRFLRQPLECRLIVRAWKDEAFKDRLLRDPREVINTELAHLRPRSRLPAEIELIALEETETKRYLVIPRKPKAAQKKKVFDEELTLLACTICELEEMEDAE